MRRFHYALDPALRAARSDEDAAARAFAISRAAASVAESRVATLVAAERALRAAAAAPDRASESAAPLASRSPQTLVDRERSLLALATQRLRAAEAAERTVGVAGMARADYEARVRRRRTFEAHRERALATYRRAQELAEAAELDEANAASHEAASGSTGKDAA